MTTSNTVVSDTCRGLVESIADYLPEARRQRCVRSATCSRPSTPKKAEAVTSELRRQRVTRAAKPIEESIGETLAFYAVPDWHLRKVRTDSPLDRNLKEIRRRTKMVGGVPDGQHCLSLAAARMRHIAGGPWRSRAGPVRRIRPRRGPPLGIQPIGWY